MEALSEYTKIEGVSLRDLMCAILVMKKDSRNFKESDLEKRLRDLIPQHRKLAELFWLRCDGTPSHTNEFYATVHDFCDYNVFNRLYLRGTARCVLRAHLKKTYDADTMRYLKSFVDKVWA